MQKIQRVCVAHNHYQQAGGEDTVFAAEVELLESHGIEVTQFTVHNDAVKDMSPITAAAKTVWNAESRRALEDVLRRSGAQILHLHNTFPLISPAAHAAGSRLDIPVVQTLHNFRLVCANALLFRDGSPCEDCVGRRFGWPGVQHACYRGSRAASAVVAGMTAIHRFAGTWNRHVSAFIALNEFARSRFVRGGLPADRIHVKPNFVGRDPGMGKEGGEFALYVGRLAAEKGIRVLRDAWLGLGAQIPLRVAGDGPEAALLDGVPGVELLGRRSTAEVVDLMREARILVFPSLVYEGFPLVLAEAFATGLPIIASNRGAAASLVQPGETGALFEPDNASALAEAVSRVWNDRPALARMRRAARATYEAHYTADANFEMLMEIYDVARRTNESAA